VPLLGLLALDAVHGADLDAGVTIVAAIRVDDIDLLALADAPIRALRLAGRAGDALIRDYVWHLFYLLAKF
jgi:hypothetical protein